MANEAVIIELYNGGRGIRYACADGVTIEKGALLELTDPRTVQKISATDKPIAGIAAAEKVANDGATSITALTDGIFRLKLGASATSVLGADVVSDGSDNTIKGYDTLDDEKGYVVGKSLETGANNDLIVVRVNL